MWRRLRYWQRRNVVLFRFNDFSVRIDALAAAAAAAAAADALAAAAAVTTTDDVRNIQNVMPGGRSYAL